MVSPPEGLKEAIYEWNNIIISKYELQKNLPSQLKNMSAH